MALNSSRLDQQFPRLGASQLEVAKRFASGQERQFRPGETVFDIGERNAPAWLVLHGQIEVFRHDGLAGEAMIINHGVGQFSGEISQLSGRPSLAGGRAGPDGCTAIAFDGAGIRALMIGSAEIGELVMRAFILRRVALIEEGSSGAILLGNPGAALTNLDGFLARSGHPHIVLDATSDGDGRTLVERLGISHADLPLVVCPDGTILKKPSEQQVAHCLGLSPDLDPNTVYDVAVIGGGPAGLASAVYAASEGLKVIVLEQHTAGGQAGASMRIENYLGFPTGITGHALAARAFNQALKFGAEIAFPLQVTDLGPTVGGPGVRQLVLNVHGAAPVRARTVVIATGAQYRRPGFSNIEAFEGNGVSYWASPIEARLCLGEEVALVGGGNSAGQAVAFLAPQVKRLHLVVRRALDETMSAYLIDRIAAFENVELHVGCEVTAIDGDPQTGLSSATIRGRSSGVDKTIGLHHLFLFIGADPKTDWLKTQIALDDTGFVITGEPSSSASASGRQPLPLETNVPNVFAIGDVRSGSTKRVAAAVGEGAAVVAQIHAALKRVP
uniref:FAD-dependent oxidoreductase n=1 Tax=Neorhizobium sp. EC2-8 TaxID=3129230 RepID=UPI00310125A3